MGQMTKRIEKLEDRLGRDTMYLVGVVSAPIPSDDLDGWADRLLLDLGWAGRVCAVTVVAGTGPEVLLPLTRIGELRGDRERVWLDASDGPHVWLIADGRNVLSIQFEDAPARLSWCADLEREMAAAGGPDEWVRGGGHG